jgi:hypothetical protein
MKFMRILQKKALLRKSRILILLITLVVFFWIIFGNFRLICATINFFITIEAIDVPHGISGPKGFSLDDVASNEFLGKVMYVARFLQSQPEQHRRSIIFLYNTYIDPGSDKYLDQVLKLYLIQRFVFEVPDKYPSEDAKIFVGWIGKEEADLDGMYNLLWPLRYEGERLTLPIIPWGFRTTYNAVEEYDYFFARFRLRNLDKLK